MDFQMIDSLQKAEILLFLTREARAAAGVAGLAAVYE